MRQLALDLKLADSARFDTFFAGRNAVAVAALQTAINGAGPSIDWFWGSAGSGKSHLQQAAIAESATLNLTSAWLPLARRDELTPDMLEGLSQLDLVCIDDIDSVAADPLWERALFMLCEEVRASHTRLICMATAPPTSVGFALPDLASRLAAGPVWKIETLQDQELIEALQLRAHWRGFELPDDTSRYLLRRLPRTSAVLFALLDELDTAALRSQRRLTIPFVKDVLELSD